VPGWISGLVCQRFRVVGWTWPTFLKTNVTLPRFAMVFCREFEQNSPPLTWIVVVFALRRIE